MEQRAPLSFGTLLKRYRRTAGLTQEQLAEQAGYSVSYVSMLERGERVPVRATRELLAHALGLTAADQSALEAALHDRDTLTVVPSPPRFARLVIASPPLAGRTAEVARIARHLAHEGPPLLLFAGEPGIGKSRLLAEARARGEATGWITLAGAAQRGGSQQPYSPVIEAIEQHVGEQPAGVLRQALTHAPWLTRLLPELADISPTPQTAWTLLPEQERRLIFTAVAHYLAAVGGPSGTLLILDDLQWAGTDALDLLASLLRSPATARLRVIGAYRDAELDPASPLATHLADMATAGSVTRLPLGPLADEDAASLVRVTLPAEHPDDGAIERIMARGGGVPFYLVSFAQSLAGKDGAPGEIAEDIPWDIAQTIRQRVAALPVAAPEMLAIAAIAGRSVQRTLLYSTSREVSDQDTLAVALDATCRARLLVEQNDDSYAFSHDLAREVILHEIGQARRAALHLRIGEALEASVREMPAEDLAYHFARSGHVERALPYLAQAGARARAMQAYASAAARYAELADSLDQLARPLEAAAAREQLGEIQTIAGRYGEAITALEAAARGFHASSEYARVDRIVAKIGLAYAASGDVTRGIHRLEPLALIDHAAPNSPRDRAELWDALAQLYNVGGRYADQLSATLHAAALAQATGDTGLRAQTQMRYGSALRMLGRLREATEALEEAILLSTSAGDEQNLAYALENVSVVYLLQGKLHQTNDYVQQALDLAQRLGDPIVLALMTLRRGMSAYALGRWDAALADYDSAEAQMREVGVAWVSAYTLIGPGQLHLARGESELGARLLTDAVDLATRSGDLQALRWAQTALAEWDILEGRPQVARDRLESLLDHPGQQEGLVTYLLPYLAWACARTNDAETAQQHIRACLARAEAEQIHLALVDALRIEALLALNAGAVQAAAAQHSVLRAIELCHAMPYPYGEAKALDVLGLLCRAQGDDDSAQAHWNAATQILAQLGEHLYADRVAAAHAGIDR